MTDIKPSDFTARSDYVYGQPYSFSNGSINGKMSSLSWNDINLRIVLDDIHDKYITFNISLAVIEAVNSLSNNNTSQCYNGNCIATFGNNQDVCNIALEHFRVVDDVLPTNPYDTDLTNYTGTAGLTDDTTILDEPESNNFEICILVTGVGTQPNKIITEIISSTEINISKPTIEALNATDLIIKPIKSNPNCVLFLIL